MDIQRSLLAFQKCQAANLYEKPARKARCLTTDGPVKWTGNTVCFFDCLLTLTFPYFCPYLRGKGLQVVKYPTNTCQRLHRTSPLPPSKMLRQTLRKQPITQNKWQISVHLLGPFVSPAEQHEAFCNLCG